MRCDFLIAVAIALVAPLGSCSADPPEVPGNGEIAFDLSRTEPTTTLTIPNFKITAFKWTEWGRGEKIMDNVLVVRTGLNRWEYSPAIEWPAEPVNFYAVSPMEVTMNDEWNSMTVNYHQNAQGVNGQAYDESMTDLLVGVRIQANQSVGRLRLNFRHALARIRVKVSSDAPEGQVVRIARIVFQGRAEGKLSLPNATTSPETNDGSLIHNWQIWNTFTQGLTLFEAVESYMTLSSEPVEITGVGRYLVPDFLKPVQMSGSITGQRFEVVYRIVDADTGKQIWPDASTDYWDLANSNSREWGVGRFGLYGHVPDNTLYPGVNYSFSITVSGPSHLQPSRGGESITVEASPID